MIVSSARANITVISVSWYSGSLLDRLIRNLVATAEHPERIRFWILDNTNGRDAELSVLRDRWNSVDVESFDCGDCKGSWAHALALNFATPIVTTPYTLVVDPDVHVFKSNWDSHLIATLRRSCAVAAGAPYAFWKLGKYHDFPSPIFSFYDTGALKNLGIDWTPFPVAWFERARNMLARQVVRGGLFFTRRRLTSSKMLLRFGRRVERSLGICAPDTGWLIAERARKLGLKAVLFKEVLPDDSLLFGQPWKSGGEILAREFELFSDSGEIFLTHLYSSGAYVWRTDQGQEKEVWLSALENVARGKLG
jgi:hypothetical protein